jgi:ubiquinone/menaquinone biosynthesis C-methylase UbiE
MNEKRFDVKKLHKLNNPDRLLDIPPEYIWRQLNIPNPDVLVDIGAGTGFFSVPFLHLANGGKLYACDTSDTMIEWMESHICPQNPGITPLKMQESRLPIDDETANLVYMINLHHELDNPLAILSESYRILKNSGKIFIVDWKKADMDEGPPKHIRWLPEQVKEQMKAANFREVRLFNGLAKHFLLVGEKA